MANGVLGLGAGQAASLNSDLIEKLKTAERKSAVAPIEAKIEKMVKEKETFSSIETKVAELLESIKPFDLFVSGAVTAFEQKSATTSGDSVTFDAVDVKALNKGFTSVDIIKLAQKDVYESGSVVETKDTLVGPGNLNIKIAGQKVLDIDTTGLTYEELAKQINAKAGISASVEQVGDKAFKLVIKSEESGLSNALEITGTNTLGIINKQPAQDMEAEVDGIAYSVSSNSLVVDGLKINANKIGVSTINISQDNSQIEAQMKNFVDKYNELVALIETETLGSDSSLEDRASIKGIVNQIKDKLFGSYGDSKDKSIFNYGIELDKFGGLSIDSKKFSKVLQEDMAGLRDLFVGVADEGKRGLGTVLKETLDTFKFSGGVLNSYDAAMKARETLLNQNKEKAEKSLDVKYQQLAMQFGSYRALINQMESSFSGLKLMIQQSIAG